MVGRAGGHCYNRPMSGHSKWSQIKRQKGVNDAKRGALFTKLTREIITAARQGGGDVDGNYRLRMAVDKALEKDPAERYQTMRDLVVDLRRMARQSGAVSAVSGRAVPSSSKPWRRLAPFARVRVLSSARRERWEVN